MRSILVGLDGSEDSLSAQELGITWSKKFDALLVGIGVVDEPTIRGSGNEGHISPSYQAAYDQLLQQNRRQVEQALEQFALRCSEAQVAFKLLEDEGQPCERILRELERYDLLILGCQTHFRYVSKQHTCHTLENVLRSASRPVIVMPKTPLAESGDTIIVAYDGSVQSARALQAFRASGLQAHGSIEVVSVHQESKVEAAKTADRAIEYLRFHDIDAKCVPIVGGSPSQLLQSYAEESKAGLVVMGAYGQARMKEFFFGSVTCTLLQESQAPLLLYH